MGSVTGRGNEGGIIYAGFVAGGERGGGLMA
jgi:hypothetical protein